MFQTRLVLTTSHPSWFYKEEKPAGIPIKEVLSLCPSPSAGFVVGPHTFIPRGEKRSISHGLLLHRGGEGEGREERKEGKEGRKTEGQARETK